MAKEYDTFLLNDLSDLVEGKDIELLIRDLTPGPRKYEGKFVRARVSSSTDEFADRLWMRFQKGQVHPEPWSIKVIEEIKKIPPEWA
jgi:phenylphosphate carboxylase gamma subunit